MPEGQLILEPPASPVLTPPVRIRAPVPLTRAKRRHAATLLRDSIHVVERGETVCVVSENYSYKSEAYYSILSREVLGQRVAPGTRSILDAFVVPVCLERARIEGIPVAEYTISQSCIPAPAVIYGLNYFACTSHFEVLDEDEQARERVRHVTHNGRYPFCAQRMGDGTRIHRAVSVFGQVAGTDRGMAEMATRIWECFRIPLVELVCLSDGGDPILSSLCPVRYSHLSKAEKEILQCSISGQEFL